MSKELSQSSLDKFFKFVASPEKNASQKFNSPLKKSNEIIERDLFVIENGLASSQYLCAKTRSPKASTSKSVVIGSSDDDDDADKHISINSLTRHSPTLLQRRNTRTMNANLVAMSKYPKNLVDESDDDDQENTIGRYTSKSSAAERYAIRKANKKLAEQDEYEIIQKLRVKQRKLTYVDMDEGLVRTFRPASDAFTNQFSELQTKTVSDADPTLMKEKLAGSLKSPTTAICALANKQLNTPLREYHNLADRAHAALRHTDKRVLQPFKAPQRLPSQEQISSDIVGDDDVKQHQNKRRYGQIIRKKSPVNKTDMIEKEAETTNRITHPDLQKFDSKIVEIIENEIYTSPLDIVWNDIAGLDSTKRALQEIVVWPFQRPELFFGVRMPAKGVLLFGPPGTGKTMLARCIAAQCHAAFFNVSVASLTSKWVGEAEKITRALFAVARTKLPAVIFIDEIDSLLSARNDTEHESSRRIKTEFLTGLDGLDVYCNERLLILGATNRPEELDEAVRRRFTKRLYIPLPEHSGRKHIIQTLLKPHSHSLTDQDIDMIASLTAGYSGADVRSVTAEAAYGPLRDLKPEEFNTATHDQIRPIQLVDFENAIKTVKPSVSRPDLLRLEKWNELYGVTISV